LIQTDRQSERAKLDCRFWPIASFRCDAEFDRYRGKADSRGSRPKSKPAALCGVGGFLNGRVAHGPRHLLSGFSTQLVVEGVHPHKKDQILGHAADDMSRHYTHVPQAP
jgi:hypothetical protein